MSGSRKRTTKLSKLYLRLRDFALSLPETHEDHPWGHPALKVRKKAFLFMSAEAELSERLGASMKLPESADLALSLPFTEPTGYGLGKSGWVSISFAKGDDLPPADLLLEWVEESYRAIAPKTLVRLLDAAAP